MADRDQGLKKIIVKNYPQDTADRDLQIMFEKYGKIEDLFTPTDRITRKPRGFTFIRYRRQEDADDAIRGMNGRDIDGFKILVERAAPRGAGMASFRGGRDSGRGGSREGRGRGRESWEPPRGRRRSVSPRGDPGRRRFRSQSPPRDHRGWREREERDFQRRDAREMFDPYDSRDMMPPHGRYGGDPSMMEGGLGGMVPHPGGAMDSMHHHMMGGPPPPMHGGRKTLLDTPPVPPLASSNAGDGYDTPGGYPPQRGPSQRESYRGDDDHYGPGSQRDPYPPSRDAYGGPPPSRGGGHSARGHPPATQYGNPPSASRGGGGGYYDDEPYPRGPSQSHSSGIHQGQYSGDGYTPPPERGGGQQYRDESDYESYPSAGRGGPPGKQDPYYSSSNYMSSQSSGGGPYSGGNYSSGPPNSEYRSSNPSRMPASSNQPQSSYSRDYGNFGGSSQSGYDYGSGPAQRSGYGSETAEYSQGPPGGGYGSGRHPPSDTPSSNPYSQRGSGYSSTYGSRGNPANQPPPSASGPGGKDPTAPMGDRYYGGPPTQNTPRAPSGGYGAGALYGASDPPGRGGFSGTGPKGGGYGVGGQQNVGYGNRGDASTNVPPGQPPKYGQSYSYSNQGQRGSGPPLGGNRMAPTSTGFVSSQGYTKPGPQY